MPELPEIEVIRQGLVSDLKGRRVISITCSGRKLRGTPPCQVIERLIAGHFVLDVTRRAKYLLIYMDNGATLVFHLGMSGRLRLCIYSLTRTSHDHLCFSLDNGRELRFTDPRRFGSVRVFAKEDAGQQDFFARLGPEPLGSGLSAAALWQRAQKRRRPIKNFLMDGTMVAGIGNIYANEILFAAGIQPFCPAADLNENHWLRVVEATRKVLRRAIECGGTTIADFVNSNGEPGSFQKELRVYGRAGKVCLQCGAGIIRIRLAGRSTYYCPCCQQLPTSKL